MKTVITVLLSCVMLGSASNAVAYDSNYDPAVVIAKHKKLRSSAPQDAAKLLERELAALTSRWMGTPWGLGLPQTDRPGKVKINCGMFVGTLLVHLGFNVSHKKLQRQPAELIIKSLTKPSGIHRWRNKSIETFSKGVESLGDGWFVLGLDNHVGFIQVEDGVGWFVHADYVTETVRKERLIDSPSVRSSKYRVVGRLFQPQLVDAWRTGGKVKVIGKW